VIKLFYARIILGVCVSLIQSSMAYASERLLDAKVTALAEYNDNIFLSSGPHDSVTGITITPSLSGIIKEKHWEAALNAKLRVHRYSDDTIDGNDQFFDLTGQYNAQRNIYSLNINHDLDSNLSSTSTDFGIAGRRIDRKRQSITPQYTRLLTERLVLSLSYTYSDVDYLDAENTGFTPYVSESGSIALQYGLTEKDQISLSFQLVDYRSKNDLTTYKLFTTRVGIDHQFTSTLSSDFQIGVSRQNSTNLNSEPIDFLDQTLIRTLESDSNNRGLVLDAGIKQLFESGSISGRISRSDTTNSFGGLNQVDKLVFLYDEQLSSLWRYDVNVRFEDITAISANNGGADRDVFVFSTIVSYSIAPKWSANASYRYIARRFKSDTSDDRAPHSNRIYVGMTYNFPSLSTF